MDLSNIKSQLEIANNAILQIKEQNRIFDTLISKSIAQAPEKDKKTIEQISLMSKKAINLAKKGEINKANDLIKNFKYGR